MARLPTEASRLSDLQCAFKLDRNLLKDLAAETLRDQIIDGRIPEGTKLTEREVSQILGISRMPARDALMALEAEGLVVQRPDGRYVIALTEADVRDLYTMRWTLEKMAVELAASNVAEADCAALQARLRDLERAVEAQDPALCTRCDMAIHQAIWRQANNTYLVKILDSVLGTVFVLCARANTYGPNDWQSLLDGHRQLVHCILAGDGARAAQIVEQQLRAGLVHSLSTFRVPGRVPERDPRVGEGR